MKYQTLDIFKVKTLQGEMVLHPGQVINLQPEKAIKLLNEGKITPLEKVAYKVYSEILQAYLWIVDTDRDMHSLRSQGITEAIYSFKEIKELMKLSKEDLKEIHRVKEAFPESTIEEINKKKRR
ncbi:MAG: hypothetical protein DDT19_02504 [Syntrophomonadaceae bacterium]|nr:hypothetical protein [Bacillota bacterium]